MSHPKPTILLDTDLGGDIDDLGTVALLHALADAGKCDILGFISDTPQAPAVGAIDAVNRWYGRPGLPVGRRAEFKVEDTYANAVVDASGDVLDGHDAPMAVDVYRRLLAAAPDGSVTIATIGVLFLLNDLLDSGPDDHSPMTGPELVDAKVDRFVVMGGRYPRNDSDAEANFHAWGQPNVSKRAIERIDRPITFIGGELGDRSNGYGTGARLNDLPEDHPVRIGYLDFFRRPPWWVPDEDKPWDTIQPWSIWDQITVHHAVCRDLKLYEEIPGVNHIGGPGTNAFEQASDGPHVYLRPLVEPGVIAHEVIEPLMLTRPTPAGG
ncbi:MAG: hypothetical protein AAFX76_09750 [Planctomycetota bacterium]